MESEDSNLFWQQHKGCSQNCRHFATFGVLTALSNGLVIGNTFQYFSFKARLATF